MLYWIIAMRTVFVCELKCTRRGCVKRILYFMHWNIWI